MIINHKKVVFIGASSKHLHMRIDLIKKFLSLKNRVYVILSDASECVEIVNSFKYLGCDVIDIPFSNAAVGPLRDVHLMLKFRKFFKSIQPDILLNFALKPVLYGSIASYLMPKTKVFSTITGMGSIYTSKGFKNVILRSGVNLLYKIACARNSIVFFQNSIDQDFFIQNKFIPKEKAVLQNGTGVNLDRFGQTPLPEEKIFLFVARLIKEKGLLEYIDASSRLKKKYPDARFQILGGAHTNPSAIPLSRVERLCKEGGIEYLGEHPSAFPFLQKCSVFVLPTYYREGLPVSGVEALAVGRPVIMGDMAGCRPVVIQNENGFLIPTPNAQALYDAMEKMILASYDELVQMGNRSRALAEERFDVHKVNKVTLDAIERC